MEFGAKMDLSLDEKGMARIEKMSFDAYNESDVLIAAVERYFERTGHYTTRSSIALSVIAMNVDRINRSLLRLFFDIVFSRCKQHEFMLINIQNNNAGNLACC